jgi:hypothetical protein
MAWRCVDQAARGDQLDDEPTIEQVLQVCQAVDLAERTDDPRSELAARNFVCKVLKNLFAEPKRGPGRPPGQGSPCRHARVTPGVLALFAELERTRDQRGRAFEDKAHQPARLLNLTAEWWTCNGVLDRSAEPCHPEGYIAREDWFRCHASTSVNESASSKNRSRSNRTSAVISRSERGQAAAAFNAASLTSLYSLPSTLIVKPTMSCPSWWRRWAGRAIDASAASPSRPKCRNKKFVMGCVCPAFVPGQKGDSFAADR